jgi:hypothetical protein
VAPVSRRRHTFVSVRSRLLASGTIGLAVLTAALATVLCADLGDAAAHSAGPQLQTFFEYTISFVGHGSYEVVEASEGPGRLTTKASFAWKTVYPNVLIPTTGSSPLLASGYPAYGLGQDGSGSWNIVNTGDESEDCSHNGTLGIAGDTGGGGGGGVKVHRVAGGSKGIVFNLVALNEFTTASGAGDGVSACEPENFWHDWVLSFSGVGSKHTSSGLPDVAPLSASVTLTPADLKHGVYSKSVSVGASEQIPTDCGTGDGSTCTQSYSWSGNVRFTKHKLKTH